LESAVALKLPTTPLTIANISSKGCMKVINKAVLDTSCEAHVKKKELNNTSLNSEQQQAP
jgi:hypothetical protein